MYDRDKMKELLTERDKLGIYDEYQTEEIWKRILSLLQSKDDLDKFAEYMTTEMTYDEYGTLGEIVDEIDEKNVTRNFVEALRKLIIKYPFKGPADWEKDRIENVMLHYFEEELEKRERLNESKEIEKSKE